MVSCDDLLRIVLVEQLHCDRIKMVEVCLCVNRPVGTGRRAQIREVIVGGVLKELDLCAVLECSADKRAGGGSSAFDAYCQETRRRPFYGRS